MDSRHCAGSLNHVWGLCEAPLRNAAESPKTEGSALPPRFGWRVRITSAVLSITGLNEAMETNEPYETVYFPARGLPQSVTWFAHVLQAFSECRSTATTSIKVLPDGAPAGRRAQLLRGVYRELLRFAQRDSPNERRIGSGQALSRKRSTTSSQPQVQSGVPAEIFQGDARSSVPFHHGQVSLLRPNHPSTDYWQPLRIDANFES